MIVNGEDEKVSAKILAQEILLDELQEAVARWLREHAWIVEKMTDREFDLVNEHLFKQFVRVSKVLGGPIVDRQEDDGTITDE